VVLLLRHNRTTDNIHRDKQWTLRGPVLAQALQLLRAHGESGLHFTTLLNDDCLHGIVLCNDDTKFARQQARFDEAPETV